MTISMGYMLKEKGISVTEVMYPEVDIPFHGGDAAENAMKADRAAFYT